MTVLYCRCTSAYPFGADGDLSLHPVLLCELSLFSVASCGRLLKLQKDAPEGLLTRVLVMQGLPRALSLLCDSVCVCMYIDR